MAVAAAIAAALGAAPEAEGSASGLAPLPAPGESWAVVTGASSGIGAELARACAGRGYGVVLSGRRRAPLDELAREIEGGELRGRAKVLVADLAMPEGPSQLHDAVVGLQLEPALFVSCAGFAWSGQAVQQPADNLQSMLALNVAATAQLCRLFAQDMVTAGRGRLLLVGSVSGTTSGIPGVTAYVASKAFIRAFAVGLREELRPAGVGVTCLMPGATDSAFAAASGMERALSFRLPFARELGVVSRADDVARQGLEAALRGDAECVPGLLNSIFSVSPDWVKAPVGTAMMNEAPWLQAAPGAAAAPRAATAAAFAAAVAAGAPQSASALDASPPAGAEAAAPVAAAVALLAGLIGLNVFENGAPADEQPRGGPRAADVSLEDVLALRSKSEFVALWRQGSPPSPEALRGREFGAQLLPLGPLWASSWIITNLLFAPGRLWIGKGFGAEGGAGYNVFRGPWRGRRFGAAVGPSLLDGRPALVLDYGAENGDAAWGAVAGMRDELREVAPGLLLGLGSMRATGGAWNCAPFVLCGDLEL